MFKFSGTTLDFSLAYHPQSDAQTEVVNHLVEIYLRCLLGEKPKEWVYWLAWAKYCYNTGVHSYLQATPFKVGYACTPPKLLSYDSCMARLEAVDHDLRQWDFVLQSLQNQFLQA